MQFYFTTFAALNFMARKIFSYVACLASLLNCIIIYIFIYEHFLLANNKSYKLICVIWAIIISSNISYDSNVTLLPVKKAEIMF